MRPVFPLNKSIISAPHLLSLKGKSYWIKSHIKCHLWLVSNIWAFANTWQRLIFIFIPSIPILLVELTSCGWSCAKLKLNETHKQYENSLLTSFFNTKHRIKKFWKYYGHCYFHIRTPPSHGINLSPKFSHAWVSCLFLDGLKSLFMGQFSVFLYNAINDMQFSN